MTYWDAANNCLGLQYGLIAQLFPNHQKGADCFNPTGRPLKNTVVGDNAANFDPDEWANTNGMKGMYIGNRNDWKQMVSVSDEVKQKLAKTVKEDFITTNGKAIPEATKRHSMIVDYLGTIDSDKRASATWTLQRMAGDYSSRMEELVRKSHPGWKPGDAFDRTILDQLDGTFGGVDLKA